MAADASEVVWASVLASAGVAALTTLIIEYAAKPWLEVRKDRILQRHIGRRAALQTLTKTCAVGAKLTVVMNDPDEVRSGRAAATAAELNSLLDQVFVDVVAGPLAPIPADIETPLTQVASIVIAMARGVQDGRVPDEELQNALKAALDWLTTYTDALKMPRRRFGHRRSVMAKLAAVRLISSEDSQAQAGS